jgi:hypothetical protein
MTPSPGIIARRCSGASSGTKLVRLAFLRRTHGGTLCTRPTDQGHQDLDAACPRGPPLSRNGGPVLRVAEASFIWGAETGSPSRATIIQSAKRSAIFGGSRSWSTWAYIFWRRPPMESALKRGLSVGLGNWIGNRAAPHPRPQCRPVRPRLLAAQIAGVFALLPIGTRLEASLPKCLNTRRKG